MAVEDSNTKRCYKCGAQKHLTEFHKSSRNSDGVQSICKACAKSQFAEYRKSNIEKVRETANLWSAANRNKRRASNAKWRDANKEKKKALDAAYRACNREKIRDKNYSWQKANAEKVSEYKAKWRASNPESVHIHRQNYRARKRETGGTLSNGLAQRLFKLQRGKCACCGKPLGDDYHLDHIMPLALGGSNTDDNMQLLTSRCNMQKNAKHPVDFMQQRGFLL